MVNKILRIVMFTLLLILSLILFFIFGYRNYFIDTDKWFNDNEYIGHALYGVDNFSYVNTIESLKYGYSKGIRVMEVDLLYTSDNHIVVKHIWENDNVLTYDEFMNKKVYGLYSPMDLDDLINYMVIYNDLYFVIDFKEDNYLDIYKELIDKCINLDKGVLDRVIVQIYSYDMYYDIDNLYKFDNYIFTTYKTEGFNVMQISNFCIYNNIDVIALPEWSIESGSIKEWYIKYMKYKGLKVYSYTVNDINIFNRYKDIGVYGVYTDFLY